MPHRRLALIGFGNVGQAFARLLLRKKTTLEKNADLTFSIAGIFTRSHGAVCHEDGIDIAAALERAASGQKIGTSDFDDALAFLDECEADILVENSSVNVVNGEPARTYMLTALQKGMHVITANKGPIVHAYEDLVETAKNNQRQIRFESTVMDGTPIFSLWRAALPAAELHGFRGILNSTTNLVLGLMEEGMPLRAAVQRAQDLGIAETDPSGDLEGWDAAIKVAALIRVLLKTPFTPQQVAREGISRISRDAVQQVRQEGRRIKLVCEMRRDGDRIHAQVQPMDIGADDPLFQINGTSTAVTFYTDVLGALTIGAQDPTPDTTAFGLLADLISLSNRV